MQSTPGWRTATVARITDLTPTIRQLELEPEGGIEPWTPGAHIDVQVAPGGKAAVRSYSLVGDPEEGVYRIAVKRVADSRGGSAHMWTLAAGASLPVSAPKNFFELQADGREILLIAGGIGITPLCGMARTLARYGAGVRMLYAARSRAEHAYADELKTLLGERLQLFASDQGGRLDLAAELARVPEDGAVYGCGPLRMLEALRHAWTELGRPPELLRFETFGNSGRYASEEFWVKVPRHELEVRVPSDRTLLDALEDAGVEVLSDCRRGECGLCALTVLSVEGRIDHRDVFLSEDQRAEGHTICACVSRIVGGSAVLDSAYRPD